MKQINSLAASTQYDWQVQSVCKSAGLGNSEWSQTHNFTTYAEKLIEETASLSSLKLYPNPTDAFTNIQFSLSQASHVNIKVYDMSGREVSTVLNDDLNQGVHSLQFNTSQLTKGIYMVRVSSDAGVVNHKLIVH